MVYRMQVQSNEAGTLVTNIGAILDRRSLSGRELARRMGTSHSYIARRLSGEVELSGSDLARLSHVLELPVSDLFGESDA